MSTKLVECVLCAEMTYRRAIEERVEQMERNQSS